MGRHQLSGTAKDTGQVLVRPAIVSSILQSWALPGRDLDGL